MLPGLQRRTHPLEAIFLLLTCLAQFTVLHYIIFTDISVGNQQMICDEIIIIIK